MCTIGGKAISGYRAVQLLELTYSNGNMQEKIGRNLFITKEYN